MKVREACTWLAVVSLLVLGYVSMGGSSNGIASLTELSATRHLKGGVAPPRDAAAQLEKLQAALTAAKGALAARDDELAGVSSDLERKEQELDRAKDKLKRDEAEIALLRARASKAEQAEQQFVQASRALETGQVAGGGVGLPGSASVAAVAPVGVQEDAKRGHVHVDSPEEPQLLELVRRINSKLSSFFKDAPYCSKGWSKPLPTHYLGGCAGTPQCQHFSTLPEAKRECERLQSTCGGVVETVGAGVFELRESSTPHPSDNEMETAHVKLACGEDKTAMNVYRAFAEEMEAALEDPSLHLDSRDKLFQKPEDDKAHGMRENTIFLSIASYRDPNCGPTVMRAFEKAARPELLTVGVVEQNCHADCMTGTGWGETRRWVHSTPDVDCVTEFCASDAGRAHCEAGRVRLLPLNETESYGPFFARYLASKLWEGQAFFMQIDSHSHFRQDWDRIVIDNLREATSFPRAIVSNYPPGHETAWSRLEPGTYIPEALCDIRFADNTMRLEHTFRTSNRQDQIHNPAQSLFIAAGFYIAHTSLLRDVKYDPLLPYIFMGEEIMMSARAWTSGWDVYAPSQDVVLHMYVRQESPKFWETVNDVFGVGSMHNDLTDVVMDRIKYVLQWKGKENPGDLQMGEFQTRLLETYGVGKRRSLDEFYQLSGIDMKNERVTRPPWCVAAERHGSAPLY